MIMKILVLVELLFFLSFVIYICSYVGFIRYEKDVIGYCWVVVLLFYNFSIIYKFGKLNIDVDLLFRLLFKMEILDGDIVWVVMDEK